MPRFVYNKTFIDEAPVLAVPGIKRAQSAPPVMILGLWIYGVAC